jgi:hypothetical protein
MTAKEFNEKYKQYIPEGWGGLEFDIPVVTEYLDNEVMQDLITVPGFELHQIKLKFGMARFYFITDWKNKYLEAAIEFKIEEMINKLIKTNE